MPTVSVIAPCLNEKKFLSMWFDNIESWADEVIVVDGGSTDGSIEILQDASAHMNIKLILKPQIGKPYSDDWDEKEARNWLLDQATSDYILSLDIDEVLSDNFIELKSQLNKEAYSLNFISFWENLQTQRLNHPNDPRWEGYHLCLWRNDPKFRYIGKHHCTLEGLSENKLKPQYTLFHLHYGLGLKSEFDNRRGDCGCADGNLDNLDWNYLNKGNYSYQLETEVYKGDYPKAMKGLLDE